MQTWTWWLIWLGLALFALVYLGYIGWDLLQKATRAAKALETTIKLSEPLLAELGKTAELPEFAGNLLDDPAPLMADRQRNLRKREGQRQERQRRLINKLIDYQADESEFKP